MFQTPVLGPPAGGKSAPQPTAAPAAFPCGVGSYSPNPRQQAQASLQAAAALSSISAQSGKLHASTAAGPPGLGCHLQFPVQAAAGCCPVQRRKSLSPLPYAGQAVKPAATSAPEPLAAAALPLSRSPGIVQVSPLVHLFGLGFKGTGY